VRINRGRGRLLNSRYADSKTTLDTGDYIPDSNDCNTSITVITMTVSILGALFPPYSFGVA
jgi:hypothetical protein